MLKCNQYNVAFYGMVRLYPTPLAMLNTVIDLRIIVTSEGKYVL